MKSENAQIRRSVLLALSAAACSAPVAVLAADAAATSDNLEEVVVTGSRIHQDIYSSSAAVDIVAPEKAVQKGVTDLASALQTTTVASGSPQVTAASSTAFVQNGGIGAETLSLRGLGANRTLVLLNGRRAGPAGTRGGVSSFDLNVLPLGAVERIDILKDGASSIYGSDAIAGVVNIITKKGNGGTLEGFASRPTKSGGEESRVNASWGRALEHGNFRITADGYRQSELNKGSRDYFRCGQQYIFDPTTGARRDVVDPRTGTYHCSDLLWGQVWLYDYATATDPITGLPLFGNGTTNVPGPGVSPHLAQYDYDGNLGSYIPGYAPDPNPPYGLGTPPGWFPVNYDRVSDAAANADSPFQDASSLIPKIERATIYAEALFNRRKTTVNSYRQFWTYMYNSDSGGAFGTNPLAAGWTGANWLSPTPITNRAGSFIDVKYQRFVTGLRGDAGKSWNWDVSFQYSHSDGAYTDDQIYNDAIVDQHFATGSCVGQVTSVRGVPCIDVPWLDPQFLAGNISADVAAFLFGKETGHTKYTQWTLESYTTGKIVDLPTGPLNIAIGAQYQSDSINDTPGAITLGGNAWGTTTSGITKGDQKTKAIFGEIAVPLLHDLPGAKNLEFNGSVRYTNVSTYGGDRTYKAGLAWQIMPSFKVRLNQGTSFRSPALYELYLANQTSFLDQPHIDPCIGWGAAVLAGTIPQRVADNCATAGIASDFTGGTVTATIITGGGLGVLKAETSKSRTAGFIWHPSFADVNLSVDFFDIDVGNEVSQLGAHQIVFGCYNSLFFPNDPLCNLFDRSGLNNGIDNVHDSYINIADQKERGWDVELTYKTRLGPGNLTINTQNTFKTKDLQALFANTVTDTNGQFGNPKWIGNLNLTYETGPWEFYYGLDLIGPVSNEAHYGGNTATYRGETVRVVLKADSVIYHAVSVTREFKDAGVKATLGVANLADKKPPQVTTLNLGELDTQGNSAFYSQYDWVGRRFFL